MKNKRKTQLCNWCRFAYQTIAGLNFKFSHQINWRLKQSSRQVLAHVSMQHLKEPCMQHATLDIDTIVESSSYHSVLGFWKNIFQLIPIILECKQFIDFYIFESKERMFLIFFTDNQLWFDEGWRFRSDGERWQHHELPIGAKSQTVRLRSIYM